MSDFLASIDWPEILAGLFSLLIVILGPSLLQWIRQQQKLAKDSEVIRWARIAVAAAEQIYEDNQERFNYVYGLLSTRFPWLSNPELRALLEAAVLEIKATRTDVVVVETPADGDPPSL